MDLLLIVAVVVGNLLFLAVGVTVAVLIVSSSRKKRDTLDPAFAGCPVAPAVVVERTYRWRMVNERRLYRIVYRVRTPDGGAFLGWEEMFLLPSRKAAWAPGTQHPVAFRPGGGDEVRALPFAMRSRA